MCGEFLIILLLFFVFVCFTGVEYYCNLQHFFIFFYICSVCFTFYIGGGGGGSGAALLGGPGGGGAVLLGGPGGGGGFAKPMDAA